MYLIVNNYLAPSFIVFQKPYETLRYQFMWTNFIIFPTFGKQHPVVLPYHYPWPLFVNTTLEIQLTECPTRVARHVIE